MNPCKGLKVGDAIEVIWFDSHFQAAGWKEERELAEAVEMTIRSVCIFVGRDKRYIHTVADRSQEDPAGVLRDLKIPIGCIKSVRRLK